LLVDQNKDPPIPLRYNAPFSISQSQFEHFMRGPLEAIQRQCKELVWSASGKPVPYACVGDLRNFYIFDFGMIFKEFFKKDETTIIFGHFIFTK